MSRTSLAQFYNVLNGFTLSFGPGRIMGGNVVATGLTDGTSHDRHDG